MNQVWKAKHDLLEKDFDKIVGLWIKNKPCSCNLDDDIFCIHFDRIVIATLGKKVDELWNERLQIAIKNLERVTKN